MSTATDAYAVTADELRAFIERAEAQKARIKDEQEALKEIFSEAKGQGFSVPVMKEMIKLRAQKPDDRAETEAILDMYKSALGMA